VALNDTLVKYTWWGDANLDGVIDSTDYNLIDSGFTTPGATGWINGDFDYNGVINSTDYFLIDSSFQNQSGPLSPAFLANLEAEFGPGYVAALQAQVPEPTTVTVLGLGALGLLSRRRRRSSSSSNNQSFETSQRRERPMSRIAKGFAGMFVAGAL